MNVFIAGGSGTIGLPLARALRAGGHRVSVLTRSGGARDELRRLGVSNATWQLPTSMVYAADPNSALPGVPGHSTSSNS